MAFSLAGAVWPSSLLGEEHGPAPDPGRAHLLCLGDWGTNTHPEQQTATAEAMRMWTDRQKIRPEALLMLGDNWYGDLDGGVSSKRWQTGFEQMYPASHFPGPVYAVLGNHDYEKRGSNKAEAELAYAKQGGSRWQMPAKWYSFQFPEKNPLVTFLCLDSNVPGTKGFDWLPWSYVMSHDEAAEQDAWLREQLSKPRDTPFVVATAHHPLYSNGGHGDNALLIRKWDALFRDHKLDMYLTGHDHDLQHLEFAEHPTSFVISGGGGAELVKWSRPPESRGPWGSRVLGFTDLEVSEETMIVRHIGTQAQVVHAFQRNRAGEVKVLA
ncbi:metallophosphoesterase [Silvibacterium sp.]|uniref:metallophosphoesterase n=1 Tax=Silvibacterium sp. TaxID=1964179 RepID=UPI0039E4AD2B